MLYGTVPFKGGDMNELHQLIKDGRYTLKDSISQEARSLIKEILDLTSSNVVVDDQLNL